MDSVPLVTSSTIIPLANFWSSILVYHDRPHVVNRKLAAASLVLFCEISFDCSKVKRLSEIFTREALLYEIRKIPDFSKISLEFIRNVTESYKKNITIEECSRDRLMESLDGHFISVQILFPRKTNNKCVEVVIFNKKKKTATFLAILERDSQMIAPPFSYHIELTHSNNLRILLNSFEDADTRSAEWLADKLFPKLLKWAEKQPQEDTIIKSLSLVSQGAYCTIYSELKSKYGPNLVKNWPSKAATNPQKFVFEDIAIAAYLICLWKRIGGENIYFVDCGCGNGLLVYILNAEGFNGCGLDIRGRKVWELYSDKADLRIGTIGPESRFPEATWLIGNHSDELTPWLPIIALNSSEKTNYFVLPCCPYELNGQKYVRLNTALSQYGDYLDYVKHISEICGFTTSVDKLRIPSTRRTCFVGVQKSQVELDLNTIKENVSEFLGARLTTKFVPRISVEKVRNCTHLNKNLIEKIVKSVFDELFQFEYSVVRRFDDKPWNRGGTMTLKSLSEKISPEDKQSLKNECGGLQTLLRNHRYIFDVCGGSVALRLPSSLAEVTKYKNKPCWFQENHPHGCLFQSETCAYKHV